MTIDEAIKLLQEELLMPWFEDYPEAIDAIKLGVEALKYVKHMRPTFDGVPFELLLGETKE